MPTAPPAIFTPPSATPAAIGAVYAPGFTPAPAAAAFQRVAPQGRIIVDEGLEWDGIPYGEVELWFSGFYNGKPWYWSADRNQLCLWNLGTGYWSLDMNGATWESIEDVATPDLIGEWLPTGGLESGTPYLTLYGPREPATGFTATTKTPGNSGVVFFPGFSPAATPAVYSPPAASPATPPAIFTP